jgi:chromosome segregation ATPase
MSSAVVEEPEASLASKQQEQQQLDYPQRRHPGRRRGDPQGILRNEWVRKALLGLAGLATTAAGYYYDQYQKVKQDIISHSSAIYEVRKNIELLEGRLNRVDANSSEQRRELKEDIKEVKEQLNDLNTSLRRWFERAANENRR